MIRITYGDLVEARKVIERFKKPKTDKEIFYNLCLCLMVPQATFKNCMVALEGLKKHDFYTYPLTFGVVKEIIKPCRFYNRKAEYLIEAKKNFPEILWRLRYGEKSKMIEGPLTNSFKRDWLVKNAKGLGMKTASHLLRNLGATDLAIVDTHILKYLQVNGKKWNYSELEEKLRKRAKRYFISPAELDIIVWKHYSKTDWKDYTY